MRSALFLLSSIAGAGIVLLSCSDEHTEVLFPDSGIGMGSSASSAAGGSAGIPRGAGGQMADAGETAGGTSDAGVPCSTSADCIDANLCNGTEACVLGFCQAGTPLSCADGDPCTADICTPATGACSSSPLPDGSACQDEDRCDGQLCLQGVCTAGTPVVCQEDGNPCTIDACNHQTGLCTSTLAPSGASCD